MDDQRAINQLLGDLSESDRGVLAGMLSEASESGVARLWSCRMG